MGGTIIILITITTTIVSPPPGVRNFRFSICALCLLRDVEKETHKHKVLWEKYLCTSNRVGRGATENDNIFPGKMLIFQRFLKILGWDSRLEGCNNNNKNNNNNFQSFAAARS